MERRVNNILVTGGAGFIGSAFIRYLMTNLTGFQGNCINLDLLTYAGNLSNLTSIDQDSRYVFRHGDILNQALVEHLCFEYKIDTIIHFAAESHVDRSIAQPHAFIETNVNGTFSLLEVVRRHPRIHFHHVSTDEVYGCLGETGKFTEDSPYLPNSPYAASKAASDHLVRAYGRTYGLSTCISNCSNNYGPYQYPEKLIPLTIMNALQKKPIPVYGEGKNVRDWLYVEDHAKALWILLKRGRSGETYNIGGEAERRNIEVVRELARIIAEIQHVPPESIEELITYVKDRPGHDYRYAIDCKKIKNELGWHPEHDLSKGLFKTVKWYMQNVPWLENLSTSLERGRV